MGLTVTKAKARKRAKARAAAKLASPPAKTDKPEIKVRSGKFDPKTHAMHGAGGSVTVSTVSATRRGAARSR